MNSCIRMTAGLGLKRSGSYPATVAATAVVGVHPDDTQSKISADRSVLTEVSCYFYRLHRRYLHKKTLALLSPSFKITTYSVVI